MYIVNMEIGSLLFSEHISDGSNFRENHLKCTWGNGCVWQNPKKRKIYTNLRQNKIFTTSNNEHDRIISGPGCENTPKNSLGVRIIFFLDSNNLYIAHGYPVHEILKHFQKNSYYIIFILMYV